MPPSATRAKLKSKSRSKPRAAKNNSASSSAPSRAGISDVAVKKATGKTWSQWFTLLDRAGASKLPHKDIAELIYSQYNCPGWWSQMVTVGYEQAHGREKYRAPDGYRVSVSRTLPVSLPDLFSHWSDPRRRAAWLGASDSSRLVVRKAAAPKSMRITWSDGVTSIEAMFSAKGPKKAQVAVQHNKLPNSSAVEKIRSFWASALDRLSSRLSS